MKIGSTNHAILEGINNWIKNKKTAPDQEYFNLAVQTLVKASFPFEIFKDQKRTNLESALSDEEYAELQQNKIVSQLQKMAQLYMKKADELFKEVLLIEKTHVLEVAKIPFKMVTDAVVRFKDGSLRVIDYKTKAMTSNDVNILQLTSYGMGVEDILKEEVTGLEQWDFIKKKDPIIHVHTVDMTKYANYKKVFSQEINTFWSGVSSNHFPRNMRSMYCGPSKCSYWDTCMNPDSLQGDKNSIADFHGDEVKNLDTRRQ